MAGPLNRKGGGAGNRGRGWGRAVCGVSPNRPPLQVSTVRMQGVILLLFAKYYHLPFLRDVQTDCTRTGLGGYWVSMGMGLSVACKIPASHLHPSP